MICKNKAYFWFEALLIIEMNLSKSERKHVGFTEMMSPNSVSSDLLGYL